jgi:hypothetical protein
MAHVLNRKPVIEIRSDDADVSGRSVRNGWRADASEVRFVMTQAAIVEAGAVRDWVRASTALCQHQKL